MANPIRDLGNALGYVYITDVDTNILGSYPNDIFGENIIRVDALTRAPLASEIASRTVVTLGGTASGTITDITINSISILGSTASGGSLTAIALDAANKINSTSSTPEYFAYSSGETIIIYAAGGAGSTPNGYAVSVTVTGSLTADSVPMSGGTDVQGIYDAATGHKYYLNADYDSDGCCGTTPAVEGDLTNAIEITKYLIMQGLQGHTDIQTLTLASDTLTVTRNQVITIVNAETEGGAGTDNLKTISTDGFNDGDILIIRGTTTGHVITVTNYSAGDDNILLANAINFATGAKQNVIALQLFNVTGTGYRWYELYRSPQIALTVANIRSAGIPQPVSGVALTTLPTSGTIDLEAGVDKGVQVYSGTVTLVGSIVIEPKSAPTTPYLDGDQFYIDYRALATVGGNTVTIFGIQLTATQALQGRIVVMSKYRLSNTTWYSKLYYSPNGIDLVDTTALATKEPGLGNPAANGYVLSSTTGGTRSWIPQLSEVDTGWVDLNGFSWITEGSRPQYRVIGKELCLRGLVIIPLATDNTGVTLVPYATDYQTITSVTPYQGSGATGGVVVNTAGSVTFNAGSSVVPDSLFPDNTYGTGWIVAARRVNSDVSGHAILYTAAIQVSITTSGTLVIGTLKDAEEDGASAPLGTSPLRFLTTNAVEEDYAMDFRSVDPSTGDDTMYGITANTNNILKIKQQAMKHQITIDAGLAQEIGGFGFRLDGLKAYLA